MSPPRYSLLLFDLITLPLLGLAAWLSAFLDTESSLCRADSLIRVQSLACQVLQPSMCLSRFSLCFASDQLCRIWSLRITT